MRQELMVGRKAPAFEPERFLKGTPVSIFETGRVYIIEFWATWCGPCMASIPHLTRIQAENPAVTVIGVAVLERDTQTVEAFLAERSDDIAYTIAIDEIVENKGSGRVRRAWCEAAYAYHIPTSFIVDQQGRIAWAGHPEEIDAPLEAIMSGRWDIALAEQEHEARVVQARSREIAALQAAVKQCEDAGDPMGAVQAYSEAFAAMPDLESYWSFFKVRLLLANDRTAALNYAADLAARMTKTEDLRLIATLIVDTCAPELMAPLKHDDALLCVAVDILRKDKAATAEAMPASALERLAYALMALGDTEGALEEARAARTLAIADGDDETRARADAILNRYDGGKGTVAPSAKAPPNVVCEGDVCRIA